MSKMSGSVSIPVEYDPARRRISLNRIFQIPKSPSDETAAAPARQPAKMEGRVPYFFLVVPAGASLDSRSLSAKLYPAAKE